MKMTRAKVGCAILLALAVGFFMVSCWPILQPRFYTGALHQLIADADRIVVRDGTDTDPITGKLPTGDRVIFEVVDAEEVASVRHHMRFLPIITYQ